ncbi:MAG TPA: trypsin-like peptidase domain-containing protein [Acidobacteriaceae bacterium]|jgi:serine protease Do|nr:trypsin-like peptidase domain-containing protein [Acidobacteriaceae bacterium]
MDLSNRFGQDWREKIRGGRLVTTFTILGTLSACVLAGSLLTGRVSAKQAVDSSDAKPLQIPSPVTLSNGFSAIAKQVGPAVVNINTETLPKETAAPGQQGPMGRNPGGQAPGGQGDQGMQDFFNHFFGGVPGGGGQEETGPSRALGSGFIVDPRGYIITNNHVIDKADRIYVKLSTDSEDSTDPGRLATVVGVDKETDIAVIKIKTETPLPTVKLGNSDSAQVGDWVLAIGEPFGLSETVSAGIISARNRSIDEGGDANGVAKNEFQKFIQTDAAINPGNSGGPLVDMQGEVIGMNTAIFTQSAGNEGIGFAMPSNIIIGIYNQLIGPDHKVVRGSIGIQFQAAMSSAVAKVYGFPTGGVMVSEVVPGGPAAKAGIQPQDIIVSVDGKQIKNGDELIGIVSMKHPGSTVSLGVLRGGKQMTITCGISDRSKLYENQGKAEDDSNEPGPSDAGQTKFGITVQAVPQQMQSRMHITGGVAVMSVKPGSFADSIGLYQGAVITEINRKPVTDIASYNAIASSLKPGDDVAFVIRNPQRPNSGDSFVGGTLQ